jgi:hypothetical protein
MTSECPICKSRRKSFHEQGMQLANIAQRMVISRSPTVFDEAKAKDYTRELWETALEKAEERAEPDSWPLIITDDFYIPGPGQCSVS